jgi:hypothetical protein
MSGVQQVVFQNQRSFGTPPGQDAYTSAGTFSWVAPAGITSISVVAVGSGAKAYGAVSGGGGALRYVNAIATTPGETLTLVVPVSAQNTSAYTTLKRSSTVLVSAESGNGAIGGGKNGTPGIGTGGLGGSGANYAGAGGAAGYSGDGGNGNTTAGAAGGAGSGGGGGAGGTYSGGYSGPPGGGGGGVGLLGEGASGAGGAGGVSNGTAIPNFTSPTGGGKGGSGGANGQTTAGYNPNGTLGAGGNYGGGAGGEGGNSANIQGGKGAIRIIWPGADRSFPSTNTGDV